MLRKLLFSGLALIGLLAGVQNASAQLFACKNPVTGVLILYANPTTCQQGWTLTAYALATDEGRTGPYQTVVTGARPQLPPVPTGKRLVIKNITARAFLAGNAAGMMNFSLLKSGSLQAKFSLPMIQASTVALPGIGNLWVVSFLTTLIYADPGVVGLFELETTDPTPNIQATVTGELLDCTTVLCDSIAP
jgi:hypothetical protein